MEILSDKDKEIFNVSELGSQYILVPIEKHLFITTIFVPKNETVPGYRELVVKIALESGEYEDVTLPYMASVSYTLSMFESVLKREYNVIDNAG